MNTHHKIISALCMSLMLYGHSNLRAMEVKEVVTEVIDITVKPIQPCPECPIPVLFHKICSAVACLGSDILHLCAKPVKIVGSTIHAVGTLADVYIVQNVERHPYITGLLTIAAVAAVLQNTEWGRTVSAQVSATLFGDPCPPCPNCTHTNTEVEEIDEEEIIIVNEHQVLVDKINRAPRRRLI
jgi:hypothetical protein